MTPLTDAVRLVDGDEANTHLTQEAPEPAAALSDEPLRRHVKQAAAVLAQAGQDVFALGSAFACC